MNLLVIIGGGIVFLMLVGWFLTLESQGRRHTIFLVFVTSYLVESMLGGESGQVPTGLFRVNVGGLDLRPVMVVFSAALLARVLTSGRRPEKVTGLEAAWYAFWGWYTLGIFVGLSAGLPQARVLFQGKAGFVFAGAMLVTSAADVDRLSKRITDKRLAMVLAASVVIGLIVQVLDIRIRLQTPVQTINRLGNLSNDSVTFLCFFGATVLLLELAKARPDVWVWGSALVMLTSPLARTQRASYLALGLIVLVISWVALGPKFRDIVKITGAQTALAITAVLGLAVAGVLFTSGGIVASQVDSTFLGEQEATAAAVRVDFAESAIQTIREHPVMGEGVGSTFVLSIDRVGDDQRRTAHNMILDIGMRSGLAGIFLFVVACFVTALAVRREWHRKVDPATSLLVLGVSFALVATFARAMVEPSIDFHRTMTVLGMSIGLLVALGRRPEDASLFEYGDVEEDPRESRQARRRAKAASKRFT